MKKISSVLIASLLIGTVFSKPPKWVNETSDKYPNEKYITAIGSADNIETAYERARANIAGVFSSKIISKSFVTETESTTTSQEQKDTVAHQDVAQNVQTEIKKTIEGIEIPEWWQDKKSNTFYALAVLSREKISSVIKSKIFELNLKISSLETEFEKITDKLTRAKNALTILDLYKKRQQLQLDLEVSQIAKTSSSGKENVIKPKLLKSLSDLNILIRVSGKETAVVQSSIINALNSMGFKAKTFENAEELKNTDILIAASVIFTKPQYSYHYSRWQWSQSTVTADIKDLKTNTVFLSFTVTDRQASSDFVRAKERNINSLSKKFSKTLTEKLKSYFTSQKQ